MTQLARGPVARIHTVDLAEYGPELAAPVVSVRRGARAGDEDVAVVCPRSCPTLNRLALSMLSGDALRRQCERAAGGSGFCVATSSDRAPDLDVRGSGRLIEVYVLPAQRS